MWLDEADGFVEIFRGYLPYYLLVALPIFIIMSPVNPVAASHEFSVYRMQQYDLHTVPHGKLTKISSRLSYKKNRLIKFEVKCILWSSRYVLLEFCYQFLLF